MFLIRYLAADEDGMICELARVYQIYDYKAFRPSYIGTLLEGLQKPTLEQTLLASIVDRLSNLVWMNSVDGVNGINPPDSIVQVLWGTRKTEEGYDTPEEYMEAMKKKYG